MSDTPTDTERLDKLERFLPPAGDFATEEGGTVWLEWEHLSLREFIDTIESVIDQQHPLGEDDPMDGEDPPEAHGLGKLTR